MGIHGAINILIIPKNAPSLKQNIISNYYFYMVVINIKWNDERNIKIEPLKRTVALSQIYTQ